MQLCSYCHHYGDRTVNPSPEHLASHPVTGVAVYEDFEPGQAVTLLPAPGEGKPSGEHVFVGPTRHPYASVIKHVESNTTFHYFNKYISPKEGD